MIIGYWIELLDVIEIAFPEPRKNLKAMRIKNMKSGG
jgi:hypothetical protein